VDVFPRTITHIKIQGFPASQPPKSTFSADGKSPESPVFRPFFRRLFVFYICHQSPALNLLRVNKSPLTIIPAGVMLKERGSELARGRQE
jgi:hypothetical protein